MADYNMKDDECGKNSLDVYIGRKLKNRRCFLGMSQDKLGSFVGITFQQIQKYERGANRISASTLYVLANVLSVDMTYFTDGYSPDSSLNDDETNNQYEFEKHAQKETSTLLRCYYKITDANVRKKILELIKTIGSFSSSQSKDTED